MSGMQRDDAVRVYWQPGSTAGMQAKEFLTKRGVPFISRNILADKGALDELAPFGIRRAPIVTRGDRWADGQVLADVAELVGLPPLEVKMLPPAELHRRLNLFFDAAQRYLAQLSDAELDTLQPNRPRSYRDLIFHIYNIADGFVEHSYGIPLHFESYNRYGGPIMEPRQALAGYGRRVQAELNRWFAENPDADWTAPAEVYYGRQTLHEFLERTAWHSGQHVRQLLWGMDRMGAKPDRRLGDDAFADLPMPEAIWEADLSGA
ncbi:MAG: DinB family protein [Alphaproteobacteria bacterium]